MREDSLIPLDRQAQLISPGKDFIFLIPVEKMTLYFVTGRSPGADPGFSLGGGALVSCSSSTPINHIVFFFAEYQLY